MRKSRPILIVLCFLHGCSTNSVGLVYRAPPSIASVAADAPDVTVGAFIDQRGETAVWFGAIRGGYGNPLKVLNANASVSSQVQTAFADGLRARGFQSAGAGKSFQLAGVIRKLDCSQYVRLEAHAEIEVSVIEMASASSLFTRTYTADALEGSLLAMNTGIFASVEGLRALAEKTLSQVVDKALDDPALRDSMRR